MKSKIVLAICALALPLAAATVATAAHKKVGNAHHNHHNKGKACKGEFHYFKGGKCQDSRKKK
jgi:hypothetical protein